MDEAKQESVKKKNPRYPFLLWLTWC